MKLIDKSAVVAEIKRLKKYQRLDDRHDQGVSDGLHAIEKFINHLEVKEVDLEKEMENWIENNQDFAGFYNNVEFAKHFFELGIAVGNKAQKGEIWQVVDNVNHPQADKNKIYCVFTKNRYILATVINHPKDEELLQWKCTEFPYHRYDMCEGDKYMKIV